MNIAGNAHIGQIGDRGINAKIEHIEHYYASAPQITKPFEIPQRATYFTDREDELNYILSNLQPNRVITLTGPGGMGKSALAAEVVYFLTLKYQHLPRRFPDGIVWHNFYDQPEIDVALAHIARAFGIREEGIPFTLAREALRGKQALLILDGAEKTSDLSLILKLRGRCGILITSRKRQDASEKLVTMPPLKLTDAMSLLSQWGGQWAADQKAVRRICTLVGGLPLAVRLAGRYLAQQHEFAPIYAQWLADTPLEMLDQGERRKDSVPILLEHSVVQLEPIAIQIVRVIGIISTLPFAREHLAAALSLPLDVVRSGLEQLVDFGFLVRIEERYQVSHVLIHTYARHRLPPHQKTTRQLATYYNQWIRVQTQQGLEGYAQLDKERNHILAILKHVKESSLWDESNQLVWALQSYLGLQGYSSEHIQVLKIGVHSAQKRGDSYDESSHLGNLGLAYGNLGQSEQEIKYIELALDISREHGYRDNEGEHLGNLGRAYRKVGQVQQAIKYLQEALSISQELYDRKNECAWFINLGIAFAMLGQMEQAIEYFHKALAISQEIKDLRREGDCLGNLGIAYFDLGEVEWAINYFQQALAISEKIGHRVGVSTHLGNLGRAYRNLGQAEQAIAYFQRSLTISREIDHRANESATLGNLGTVYQNLGRTEVAIEYLKQAVAISQQIGNRRYEGNQLGSLGRAYLELKRIEPAIQHLEQALAISKEMGHRRGECNHLGDLGQAYFELGQSEQAVSYLEEALIISEEIGYQRAKGKCFGYLGQVYYNLDQMELAIRYLEQALEISREIIDVRNEGVWLCHLAEIFIELGKLHQAIEYYEPKFSPN